MAVSIASVREENVQIETPQGHIEGIMALPKNIQGIVIFAHGSGSGRLSPRNQFVAEALQQVGLATLLVDLLTAAEEQRDLVTNEHRFNIRLLTDRLVNVTDWVSTNFRQQSYQVGYFGASTGAAAALMAAALRPDIAAVVSRGGRPDLAGQALEQVRAPTLLIVGGRDGVVVELNDEAFQHLNQAAAKRLEIVPGATHLFEEPGKLEEVAKLAGDWFTRHLTGQSRRDKEG
jgi:putative phosphoribosyl transferase